MICETYKDYLENNFDVKFATEEVASRFAFEDVYVDGDTFGFHGLYNISKTLRGEELLEYISLLPNSILKTKFSRRLIKKLYQSMQYSACFLMIKKSIFLSFKNFFECMMLGIKATVHWLIYK